MRQRTWGSRGITFDGMMPTANLDRAMYSHPSRSESSIAASDPNVACQSTVVTSEGCAVTPDSLGGPASAGVAETGSVVSSEVAIEE
ncbi:hypothetical protein DY000_02041027 [Brassica cretica]|uniref:VAN3-binding protein-like auxin canalisation domain-containing protein n=1 Tax=Brassica cretica TaxID=69181 RepID=A0ABQ7B814_BRACR|nr:hypothetical protein DY000_02041027 [Brassica cretica]